MKDRTIQILLIAIVLLGMLIFFLEYRNYWEVKERYQESVIFDLSATTLEALRFNGTNFVVHCEKKNGIWLAGDPQRGMGRADVEALSKRVTALNALRKGVVISPKQLKARNMSAADYGFDTPAMKIEVLDGQGIRMWTIGRKTADNKEVYVRESGEDELFTVSSQLLDIVPRKSEQLRSRVIFPWYPNDLQRIELRRTSGFVRMVKDATGGWTIQQPIEVAVDPGEFLQYITTLCQLRIEEFEAENVPDLSVYGLQEEGSKQISMGGANDSTTTLVVGDEVVGKPGYVYACRKDDTSVFVMRDEALELLNIDVEQLRDARLLTMAEDDISKISFVYGSEVTELTKSEENGWQVTTPAVWPADPVTVGKVIQLWSLAVITDFDMQTNNIAPDIVAQFISAQSAATNRIEILPVLVGDGLLIRQNGDSAVHQINLPLVPSETLNPLTYKSKRVWSLRKSDVKKLIVREVDKTEQTVERGPDGAFIAAGTSGNYQLDQDAIDVVIDTLANLTTPAYIAYNPKSLDIYGLSTPTMEFYVGFDGTSELGRVLLIGNLSTEGYYCMVKGRDVVFLLDEEIVGLLSSNLLVEPEALDDVAQ